MTHMSKSDYNKILVLFVTFSSILLSIHIFFFSGYMTSSARQGYCSRPPVGSEDCPLDYLEAAADISILWLTSTAIITVPLLVVVTLSIVALRRYRASRPCQHADSARS